MLTLMFAPMGLSLLFRGIQALRLPDEQRRRGDSPIANWGFVCAGLFVLGFCLFFLVAPVIAPDPYPGRYGMVNNIPISKADYDACGGKIPDGCPGGLNSGIMQSYFQRSQQNR